MKNLLLISLLLISSFGYSQTKLYQESSVVIGATQMTYSCANPFVTDTVGRPGYTDVTSLENWANYGMYVGDFKYVRNVLIADYSSTWGTATLVQRQALVRFNVYPNGTITSELDACYALAQRDIYRDESIESLKTCDCLVIPGGGVKRFYQTVDVTGTISTIEITTYETITD